MREVVIVSTARTPIGRAFRGAVNKIKSPTLLAHAIRHAVLLAGVDGAAVREGAAAVTMSTAEFSHYIETEIAKWGRVVKEGNIRAQ